MTDEEADAEPVVVPISGELDLHAFAPADIPSVVAEYVRACQEQGLVRIRLIHGRGKGVQRAVVARVLRSLPAVVSFGAAGPEAGGWGATLVDLEGRVANHKIKV